MLKSYILGIVEPLIQEEARKTAYIDERLRNRIALEGQLRKSLSNRVDVLEVAKKESKPTQPLEAALRRAFIRISSLEESLRKLNEPTVGRASGVCERTEPIEVSFEDAVRDIKTSPVNVFYKRKVFYKVVIGNRYTLCNYDPSTGTNMGNFIPNTDDILAKDWVKVEVNFK